MAGEGRDGKGGGCRLMSLRRSFAWLCSCVLTTVRNREANANGHPNTQLSPHGWYSIADAGIDGNPAGRLCTGLKWEPSFPCLAACRALKCATELLSLALQVRVISGDLVNMLGEVASTDPANGAVTVKVVLDSNGQGRQEETLPLPESTLLKAFNTGDHVQVRLPSRHAVWCGTLHSVRALGRERFAPVGVCIASCYSHCYARGM